MRTVSFAILVSLAPILFMSLSACQSSRKPPSIAAPLTAPEAQKKWQASSTKHNGYEMTYKVECLCEVIPVVTVKVDREGRVQTVSAIPQEAAPSKSEAMTIERLFKIVERNKKGREPASELRAKFDRFTGAPESIFIDPDAAATDDEERIVVLKFQFAR